MIWALDLPSTFIGSRPADKVFTEDGIQSILLPYALTQIKSGNRTRPGRMEMLPINSLTGGGPDRQPRRLATIKRGIVVPSAELPARAEDYHQDTKDTKSARPLAAGLIPGAIFLASFLCWWFFVLRRL